MPILFEVKFYMEGEHFGSMEYLLKPEEARMLYKVIYNKGVSIFNFVAYKWQPRCLDEEDEKNVCKK